MDTHTHRKILAQMYGCPENKILDQFESMTSQIRNDAILTLSIQRPVTVKKKTEVYA